MSTNPKNNPQTPKNRRSGCGIPEIRFAGFTGDWVFSTLDSVACVNPKSSLPDFFYYVDLESVIGTKIVSSRVERLDTAPSRAKRLAQVGDVFFQTVRPYQRNNTLFNIENANYVFSTGYAQLRSSLNSNFIFAFIQSDFFVSEVLERCTGTSYPAIAPDRIGEISCSYPTELSEQQAIGGFFRELDELIAASGQQLVKLGELKTAMLTKMFPKPGEHTPEIRFSEFTGDWEVSALGDFSFMYQPKTISQRVFSDKGVPVFGANSFIGFYKESNHLEDQVTLAARGSVGSANFVPGPSWITGNSMVISVNEFEIDKYFLYINLSLCGISKFVTGGVQGQLTKEVLQHVPIVLPSFAEQKLIGGFFRELDSLIEGERLKLAKLKQLRAAFLQRMFV